jgi:hypothetical protein
MMTIRTLSATETLTRLTGEIDGRGFELCRHEGGRVELYQDYEDTRGLPQFVGYLDAIRHHIPASFWRALQPAVEAFEAAHREHWGAFLPGADRWLHDRTAHWAA